MIPCNLYGRHDKFEPRHSHLIPAILHKLTLARHEGLASVDIWGDGSARREFMYAGDLADAVMHGLETFEQLPELLNIGLGHDHSINEYYASAARVIGWEGQFTHDLTKPVGMQRKLVAIDRQIAWGWKPATSLEAGIARTYDYYLSEAAR